MKNAPFIHMIKTPLFYYVFDVNTNQIVEVDEELYDHLSKVRKGKVNEKEVSPEIEIKLSKLKDQGYLLENRPLEIIHGYNDLLEYHLNENIEHITLQVTQECNFRCAYCVYTPSDFTYQRQHSSKKMTLDMAIKAIDFFVNHSINQKSVCIGFYGGEPLLEFNLIKAAVDYAEKAFEGKDLMFTMTTNGSLFTPEIMTFLSEHNFDVMISLDGTPEIHDKSRRFASTGGGTFEVIEKNLRRIKEEYPKLYKELSINVVVDPRNSCDDLHEMFSNNDLFSGITLRSTLIDDFFSIEKVIETEEYSVQNGINMFKGYLARLNRYPDEKVSNVVKSSIGVTISKQNIDMKPQRKLGEKMSHSGPCIPGQRRLFISTSGEFFPCEKVSETSSAMSIGNIYNGFDYDKARSLLNIGKLSEENCKNCWAILHCTICAKLCDNNGELSKELKVSNCKNVHYSTENKLRDYLVFKEMKNII